MNNSIYADVARSVFLFGAAVAWVILAIQILDVVYKIIQICKKKKEDKDNDKK